MSKLQSATSIQASLTAFFFRSSVCDHHWKAEPEAGLMCSQLVKGWCQGKPTEVGGSREVSDGFQEVQESDEHWRCPTGRLEHSSFPQLCQCLDANCLQGESITSQASPSKVAPVVGILKECISLWVSLQQPKLQQPRMGTLAWSGILAGWQHLSPQNFKPSHSPGPTGYCVAWFLPSSLAYHTELPPDLPDCQSLFFKPSTLHNKVPSDLPWLRGHHDITICASHTATLHPSAILRGWTSCFIFIYLLFHSTCKSCGYSLLYP